MRSTQKKDEAISALPRRPSAWVEALDRLGLLLILFDDHGNERYRTATVNTILVGEPLAQRERLLAEARRVAGTDSASAHESAPNAVATVWRSQHGCYALRASPLVEADLAGGRSCYRYTLVVLEPCHARLPSPELLRARYALTRREADVALLLATRLRNAEIAATLSMSAHTARHHTEHVLDKLAVRRRVEVERVLLDVDGLLGLIILCALLRTQAWVLDLANSGLAI